MNTIWRKPLPFMTTDDFLDWPGDGSGRTFQLVDGEVRPVSPASATHGLMQANLAFLLTTAIRAVGLSSRVLTEGAISPALNAAMNVRGPDVAVDGRLRLPNAGLDVPLVEAYEGTWLAP